MGFYRVDKCNGTCMQWHLHAANTHPPTKCAVYWQSEVRLHYYGNQLRISHSQYNQHVLLTMQALLLVAFTHQGVPLQG